MNTLVLEYDLFDLPTAQHKAGLAGLLLLIETMRERELTPLPKTDNVTTASARIVFTQDNLKRVFDDFYDADLIERTAKKKWKNTVPKRIEEIEVGVNGEQQTERRFVYDVVHPRAGFSQVLFPDADGVWTRLWRDMIWNVLRDRPKKRVVYSERLQNKPCLLGIKAWADLTNSKEGNLSSSIYIGAEDKNAEKVPFKGTARHNLLLHFWPIVSLVFVPRVLSIGKLSGGRWNAERQPAGFVVAIPEPSDLNTFLEDARELFRSLETAAEGFRPKAALIDLLEEGGMEYLYHFAKKKVEEEEIFYSISAVELYHLEKHGNNVRQLAAERILPPGKDILMDYDLLRRTASNPLYKSFRIKNLLHDEPWYKDSNYILSQYPLPFFAYSRGETPFQIPFFGIDLRRKFSAIENKIRLSKGGGSMDDVNRDDQLAVRIYRLIQSYVNRKTEEKSGIKFADFRDDKDDQGHIKYPEKYRDAREKICSDVFLAVRGRTDRDFIEYFTGTIGSVPQYLPEEEYLAVAKALMEDWEKIKILSMLAISACSYL